MKYLIFLLLSFNLFAQSELLALFDGGINYNGTNLITDAIDYNFELTTPIYTSNFTAGEDSWGYTRATSTGNIDGISDGTISKDNTLRTWCDNVLNVHFASKVLGQGANKGYVMSFNYYIPSANTNVKSLQLANMTGSEISAAGSDIKSVTGAWTLAKYSFFFTNTNGIRVYERTTSTISFAGANSSTDDLLYMVDWSVREIPKFITNGNHTPDTTSTYKAGGSYALKITASGAGNGTTNAISLASTLFTAVTNGLNYRFQVYAYTSTANTTLTFKLGDIVKTAIVSTVGMTVINFDFKATASSTGNIILYLDKAATVYLDNISLKSGQ